MGKVDLVVAAGRAPAAEAGLVVQRPAAAALRGHLDCVQGTEVLGWAWCQDEAAHRLRVEILDGERVVALGVADRFRPDLLQAGIGDGRHSFSVALPAELCDGAEHEIGVRVAETGTPLAGGPKKFRSGGWLTCSGELRGGLAGLQGTALAGWYADAGTGVPLHFAVDDLGRPLAVGQSHWRDAAPGQWCFRLQLPREALDGRPHHFRILLPGRGVFAELAEITPLLSTPEDVLRRHGAGQVRPYLSASAGYRYEALARRLARLAERSAQEDAAALVAEMAQCLRAHEQVVRGFEDCGRGAALPPLAFAPPECPRVSIVIPVHDKLAVTYHCLASLLLAPNAADFEVIVVDDGSTDGTREIERLAAGIRVHRNERPQGFVRACNAGARLARGDYVVMLNNDTEVTAGWLDELLHVFETRPDAGLVGSKLLYPDGSLQEAGGIVWSSGDPENYGRGGNPHEPRFNYLREVDYISGASIMLPRPLWEELGGFDEAFAPAYFEDTDLAFRVRAAGRRVYYTPLSRVIHFEGQSNGTDTGSGIKRFQEINRPKFKSRWMRACRSHGVRGASPDLGKDRNVSFRALVLDAVTPRPDNDAGGYAAVQEMRLLQSLGFKLSFAPENMLYFGPYTEALQRMGVECLHAPFYGSPAEVIRERGGEFDLVYITRYAVAQRCVDQVREANPAAKIILNNADLHFLRELRAAVAARSGELMERALATREAELSVMRKVDLVLSYNEVEHAVILSHNLDSTRIARCPWVVELPERVPGYEARRDIAFLGGFGHPPNAEAVAFFVREVMPLLRAELPGVRFLVYGSGITPEVEALAGEDVIVKGWVRDVAEAYDACRVFVAPLLSGAGIKGKLIGALAHGVPSVVSPVAAEGTGLRDGAEARIAHGPAEWAAAIAMLYREREAWERTSAAARELTRRGFSFERGRRLMARALETVELFAGEGPGLD